LVAARQTPAARDGAAPGIHGVTINHEQGITRCFEMPRWQDVPAVNPPAGAFVVGAPEGGRPGLRRCWVRRPRARCRPCRQHRP